jgi:hypothetical protein
MRLGRARIHFYAQPNILISRLERSPDRVIASFNLVSDISRAQGTRMEILASAVERSAIHLPHSHYAKCMYEYINVCVVPTRTFGDKTVARSATEKMKLRSGDKHACGCTNTTQTIWLATCYKQNF